VLNRLLTLLILCILPFYFTCSGQEQPASLNGFGGLNTVDGIFTTKANEARIAHNVDFGRVRGAVCPRWGFDSISVHPSGGASRVDSIIEIFTLPYADGSERLLLVTDTFKLANPFNGASPNTRFGNVYVTNPGSTNLDSLTRIANWFPLGGDISAVLYRDVLYLNSSAGRGIVWDGVYSRDWPMRAPGEPTIAINTAASNLDGEYRYLFMAKIADTTAGGDTSLSNVGGIISYPVRLTDEGINITNVAAQAGDSIVADTSDKYLTTVYVYRTLGTAGRIDKFDSAYYTGHGIISGRSWQDTIPDTSLVDSASSFATAAGVPAKMPVIDDVFRMVDTASVLFRYGTPGYELSYPATAGDTGIYGGAGGDVDSLDRNLGGWAYACTFYDSVMGMESDTGRSLLIRADTTNRVKGYKINVPRISGVDSNVVVNIYRAPLAALSFDTSIAFTYNGNDCRWTGRYVYNEQSGEMEREWRCFGAGLITNSIINRLSDVAIRGGPLGFGYRRAMRMYDFRYWIAPDSLYVGAFHQIGAVIPAADSDVVFIDTVVILDSLRDRPPLNLRYVPPFLTNTFISESRLYGVSGDGVYFSNIDSVAFFGVFDQIALGVSDGEDVMLAFPTRGGVRALKQTSGFFLWQDASLGWNRQEVAGCRLAN